MQQQNTMTGRSRDHIERDKKKNMPKKSVIRAEKTKEKKEATVARIWATHRERLRRPNRRPKTEEPAAQDEDTGMVAQDEHLDPNDAEP
jgi:hypothetical protein